MSDNCPAEPLSPPKLAPQDAHQADCERELHSHRECSILKRVANSLARNLKHYDDTFDEQLQELSLLLETPNPPIKQLVCRLAIAERMGIKHHLQRDKQFDQLQEQLLQSGEVLNRVRGLPLYLKRELRNLLNQNVSAAQSHQLTHTIQLLNLYERAAKALTVSEMYQERAQLKSSLQDDLSSELQNLITELDFDGPSGEQLLTIRSELLTGVSAERLVEIALNVIRLVIDGTHQERKASQQFLQQVNTDLNGLQVSTHRQVAQSQQLFGHRQSMDSELTEIKRTLSNAQQGDNAQLQRNLDEANKQIAALIERSQQQAREEASFLATFATQQQQIGDLCHQTQNYCRQIHAQEKKGFIDHLTKVYNRAALNDRLHYELQRQAVPSHPLCIAHIDLDHFKDINDSYGHAAGDKALRIVARAIESQLNDNDFIARYSGEEFVLILNNESTEQCHRTLLEIKSTIALLPFKFRDQNVSISACIGATYRQLEDTQQALLERAERAMKEAKLAQAGSLVWL